jgi:hypothetical protein
MALQETVMAATEETVRDPESLTTNEVRQGATGFGVRYVLLISTVAALVAMAAAWVLIGQ